MLKILKISSQFHHEDTEREFKKTYWGISILNATLPNPLSMPMHSDLE